MFEMHKTREIHLYVEAHSEFTPPTGLTGVDLNVAAEEL